MSANLCVSVPFVNNTQNMEFWCWAAVAANAYNSLIPPGQGLSPVRQCDVVRLVRGITFGEPCHNKNNYNEPRGISVALLKLGIRDKPSCAPSFAVLAQELQGTASDDYTKPNPREPVCVEISFPLGAHFVAISQICVETETVWVEDPYHHGGNSIQYAYSAFASHYNGNGVALRFHRVTR
jgi:hypothetical protein